MIIEQLSVSQLTTFAHDQVGGCNRKYWFERVHDMRDEMDTARSDGGKGHALIANFLKTGTMPGKRVKMGKHVTALILKGDFLPERGNDLVVETRFDGQSDMFRPVLDGDLQPVLDDEGEPLREWIPMRKADTYWLAGVPWDGAIDLTYRRGAIPSVWDWKFSSDIDAYAKPANELIKTVQMPIYVMSQLPYWPDATEFEIGHGYIARSGIKSFKRSAIIHLDQVRERERQIETQAEEIKVVARATSQNDVPFNRRSCHAWLGCPHQSICTAFRSNALNLSAAEEALLNGIDMPAAESLADLPPLDDLTDAIRVTPPVVDAAAAAKAKKIADAKAALAALEAEEAAPVVAQPPKPATTPGGRTRPPIVDVETPAELQIPDSAVVNCALCATVLGPENSSKLQSGLRKHIGCPKESPVLAPDAPASKPELASEQPPAPKPAPKPRAPKPPPPPPAAPAAAVVSVTPAPAAAPAEPASATPVPKVLHTIRVTPRVDGPGPTTITVELTFDDVAQLNAFFAGR